MAGKGDEAKQTLVKCLGENPSSKSVHFELAQMLIHEDGDRELIANHLRRSFVSGDQNYEAQFWFGRQAFLSGRYDEANRTFGALRTAAISSALRNQVRGVVRDKSGRNRVFLGEVVTNSDAYMFVRCPDFAENIFVHRTRVADERWPEFERGRKVAFTLGFSMRGPTVDFISPLD
jgi:cold shock CspA family protein